MRPEEPTDSGIRHRVTHTPTITSPTDAAIGTAPTFTRNIYRASGTFPDHLAWQEEPRLYDEHEVNTEFSTGIEYSCN